MFAIKGKLLTALSPVSIFPLCDDIAERKRQNNRTHQKIKYPASIHVEENQLFAKPISQPMQVMWSRFSTMLVWPQENVWNWVLLEKGTNPSIV